MDDVRAYLDDLLQARAHGVPETSGYPALKRLFDAVGATDGCGTGPALVGRLGLLP